jgi:hypothetical protein
MIPNVFDIIGGIIMAIWFYKGARLANKNIILWVFIGVFLYTILVILLHVFISAVIYPDLANSAYTFKSSTDMVIKMLFIELVGLAVITFVVNYFRKKYLLRVTDNNIHATENDSDKYNCSECNKPVKNGSISCPHCGVKFD